MGNSVIFPAPKDKTIPIWMENRMHFYTKPRKNGEHSPRGNNVPFFCCGDRKITRKIPYLLFKEETEPRKSQYLIIYFHGNSELVSHIYKTLERYHAIFKVSHNYCY